MEQEMCMHKRMRSDKGRHKADGRARGDAEHYREQGVCSMAEDNGKYLVAMRLGDTPVPIPNT